MRPSSAVWIGLSLIVAAANATPLSPTGEGHRWLTRWLAMGGEGEVSVIVSITSLPQTLTTAIVFPLPRMMFDDGVRIVVGNAVVELFTALVENGQV